MMESEEVLHGEQEKAGVVEGVVEGVVAGEAKSGLPVMRLDVGGAAGNCLLRQFTGGARVAA
jgi:hypothetical protein